MGRGRKSEIIVILFLFLPLFRVTRARSRPAVFSGAVHAGGGNASRAFLSTCTLVLPPPLDGTGEGRLGRVSTTSAVIVHLMVAPRAGSFLLMRGLHKEG